jgi:hypothetical protein
MLFVLPQPPPSSLPFSVRAGFGGSLSATFELLSIDLRRARDYRALDGYLLCRAQRTERAKGEMRIEIIQDGQLTYSNALNFSLQKATG